MFGTFRYSKTTKDYEHVELSNDDNVDARGYTLLACDSCRARKLKCNGDRHSCDRCLASPSRTCTYIGRKRPRQLSVPLTPESSLSNLKRQRRLTDQRPVEESASRNASIVSITQSATSAPPSAPTPSTITSEPLPTPTCSEFPWELFNELSDPHSHEFKRSQMVPSPNVDLDWNLLDNMQSPITPSAWASEGLHISLVPTAQKSQGIRDRDGELGLEYADQQPDKAKQVELLPAPAPTLYLSQGKEVYCKCLTTMTQLLEDIDINVDITGVDTLLMGLGRGTKMCSDVLACVYCNASVDNAMLFATIAQQLVSTAKKISSRLLLVHHEGQDCDTNDWKSGGIAEMCEGGITFGRYRIELPEMKVRLVYKMVLLHLEDLQKLLANIKERIGPKRGALGLLAEAESKVTKVCWVIQELSK